MLRVIAIIGGVIAVLLGGVLAYAATKPDTFRVERTVTIKAPAEKVFPLIDNFRAQSTWSPFEKDPNMKRTHSGAERGKGAVYEWSGNSDVGSGRIAITDVTPLSKVTMELDMLSPFPAHNIVEFTLTSHGDSTAMTWSMHGAQPYLGKVISTFIDCDKMVGGMFEDGLGKLKVLAEK